MKTIPLTRGEEALVDNRDYAYLSQWKWYYRDGYAVRMARRNGRRTTIRMHRIVCERAGFQLNGRTCDHRNWNTLDNRRRNLRPATRRQQKQHTRCRKDSHTGCKGATKQNNGRKAYQARLVIDGRRRSLGYYETPEEARNVCKETAAKYFGEFAA